MIFNFRKSYAKTQSYNSFAEFLDMVLRASYETGHEIDDFETLTIATGPKEEKWVLELWRHCLFDVTCTKTPPEGRWEHPESYPFILYLKEIFIYLDECNKDYELNFLKFEENSVGSNYDSHGDLAKFLERVLDDNDIDKNREFIEFKTYALASNIRDPQWYLEQWRVCILDLLGARTIVDRRIVHPDTVPYVDRLIKILRFVDENTYWWQ